MEELKSLMELEEGNIYEHDGYRYRVHNKVLETEVGQFEQTLTGIHSSNKEWGDFYFYGTPPHPNKKYFKEVKQKSKAKK
jgi:hypothetical protein